MRPARPESRASLVDQSASRARGTAFVGLGLAVNAAVSAAQALAVTLILGEAEETDAFFAAYSLYLPVVLLGASFRGHLVPLFGVTEPEREFRVRAAELCGRAFLIGATLSAVLLISAPLSARFVAGGLDSSARETAVAALLILSPVAYLQFHGVTLSALLAAARRLPVSSLIYAGAATLGLVSSAALLATIGVIGAPLGLMAGAFALALGHEAYVRRYGLEVRARLRWLFEAEQWRFAASLSGYAALGVAQQLVVAVSLARVSETAGQITAYTFAFIIVLVLLNVTSVALGLTLMPDLVEAVTRRGRGGAIDYFLRVTVFAFATVAPLVTVAVAFGAPVFELVLGDAMTASNLELLEDLIWTFALLVVPVAVMQTAIAVGVAFRHWRFMLALALAWVIVQGIALSFVSFGDALAVAAVQVATTTVVAIVLLGRVFGDAVWRVLAGTALIALRALALCAVIALVRWIVGSDPAAGEAVVGALAGLLAYFGVLRLLWPEVGVPLAHVFRRLAPARSSQ